MMDLSVTRTFPVPVSSVWDAWTLPSLVMRWWGPSGFTAPLARMDVRPSGTSLVCMRSDGHDLYNTWTYQRVDPLSRLEFVMGFADSSGTACTPASLGLPADIPASVPHIVTFTPVGTSTSLTVTEFGYTSSQTAEMSKLGLEQCLDKMAACFA